MSNDNFFKPLAGAGTEYPERREAPRHKMSASIEMVEPVSKTRVAGQLSQISVKGCYVETPDTLPKNSVIQLRIVRPTETFETWARVASVRPGSGMGIVYLEVEAAQNRVLEGWIAELVDKVKQPG
jgi:hypothetical protein